MVTAYPANIVREIEHEHIRLRLQHLQLSALRLCPCAASMCVLVVGGWPKDPHNEHATQDNQKKAG